MEGEDSSVDDVGNVCHDVMLANARGELQVAVGDSTGGVVLCEELGANVGGKLRTPEIGLVIRLLVRRRVGRYKEYATHAVAGGIGGADY